MPFSPVPHDTQRSNATKTSTLLLQDTTLPLDESLSSKDDRAEMQVKEVRHGRSSVGDLWRSFVDYVHHLWPFLGPRARRAKASYHPDALLSTGYRW